LDLQTGLWFSNSFSLNARRKKRKLTGRCSVSR
jgi:hypothetical protein